MAGDPNAGARSPAVQSALSVVDLGRQATTAYARPDLSARLATTRKRLSDPAFHVFVIGEFKQGKSSLVNALLNAPVCPVDLMYSIPSSIHCLPMLSGLPNGSSNSAGPESESCGGKIRLSNIIPESLPPITVTRST